MGTREGLLTLKESLLWRWWPQAWGERKEDEWVKVEAFKGCPVAENSSECTPVLVQVTAAPGAPRIPVDVVAVLDITSSMNREKMAHMKEVMQVVIDNLGPGNRLSLVLLDDMEHPKMMGLTEMNEQGRDAATKMINDISTLTSHEYSNDSGSAALGAATKILVERNAEGDNRLGCIMLLSGGDDKVISTTTTGELKFAVHTFGLGADHDARPLSCIADKSDGTYSFINSSTRDAFKVFIDGLTSVAVMSVNVSLKLQGGVTIQSIWSGGRKRDVIEGEESCYKIYIPDMRAGERKNFMVYLTLSDQEGVTVEKLLTIDVHYKLKQGKNQKCSLRLAAAAGVRQSEVATELLRLKLVTEVIALAEQDAHPAADELQRKWKAITDSVECRDADSTVVSQLGKDVVEMMKPDGRPYMLAWLSRHKWQRATTMAHHSCDCRARATSSPWQSRFAGCLQRPWCAVGMVLLLAFLVMLLGLYFGRTHPPGRTHDLDMVKNHPSWPAMAKDLDVIVKRTKQGEITSFFADKTSSEMRDQIDQYLYKAIVFAAVLSDRYHDSDVYRAKLRDPAHCKMAVRRKVVKYLEAIVKMTERDTLPCTMDLFDKNVMAIEMNRYLYSVMVQTNVLVTIHTPPDVIIEDEKVQQIHDQRIKIANLEQSIAQLQADKACCCQKADARAQKLEELGSSVHDVDDAWAQKLKDLAGSIHEFVDN